MAVVTEVRDAGKERELAAMTAERDTANEAVERLSARISFVAEIGRAHV
jgi:hypothetical protein